MPKSLPVGAAPTFSIDVTQDAIDNSKPKNANCCMIARSIKTGKKWSRYVQVDARQIAFTDKRKNRRYKYFTPPKAQRELLKFDGGKKVKPFTILLDSSNGMAYAAMPTPPRKGRVLGKPRSKKVRMREKRKLHRMTTRTGGLRNV